MGPCREQVGAPLQLAEAPIELLARELPTNRPREAAILGLEGEDARLQLLQAVGDSRRQYLTLDDAEEDLDLIDPTGVGGRVGH